MGFLAMMLKRNISTFKRLMVRFVAAIVLHLRQEFIVSFREKQCKIFSLYNNSKWFSNLYSALHATDVMFHPTNRPHGSQMESNLFSSGKHHLMDIRSRRLYCLLDLQSMQVRITQDELQMSRFYVKTFINHVMFTAKKEGEGDILNADENERLYKHYGILFDEGYTGAQRDVRAIISRKKGPIQSLSILKKKKCGDIHEQNNWQELVWKNGFNLRSILPTT